EDGRYLIMGNFAQMLAASFAPITGDVLEQEIFGKLGLFPTVVKFAMLSTFSSRVLQNNARDPWVRSIWSVLVRALHERVNCNEENALVRSTCWCYLKAMSETNLEMLRTHGSLALFCRTRE